MEENNNIFSEIKNALEILAASNYPGLEKDIINLNQANEVLDAFIANPPIPQFPDNIRNYSQELKRIEEDNKNLLKKWKSLLAEIPHICYDDDTDYIGMNNILSGCFPLNNDETNDAYGVGSGIFDFRVDGKAEIDFEESKYTGSWEEVYKKLIDFMENLLKNTTPMTP